MLIFAKYLSLYLRIFTYRGTHTQAHMYNQHTRGMATTRHRSLVGRGGRKALLETLHQKKKFRKKPIFTVWDSLADLIKIMKLQGAGADDVKEVREIVQHLFTNFVKPARSKRDS